MIDFNFQWLLFIVPLAFGLGWWSSRQDLRQWRREQRDSPRAYYKGLNLLLNEQQDKAIDAFIEAVQHDPDTTELHFALGNLFRRRGEFERAVRVHQHLLSRADLNRADRERALHALAQDFMKAGLFDRAEQTYRQLQGSAFSTEASLALLDLYERSQDWASAAQMASELERLGIGSYASRMAHHWCEMALRAEAQATAGAGAGPSSTAAGSKGLTPVDPRAITPETAFAKAHALAPQAPRPLVQLGQWLMRQGRHAEALETWAQLSRYSPGAVALVASEIAQAAKQCAQIERARQLLTSCYKAEPSISLLQALQSLAADPAGHTGSTLLLEHLRAHPRLSAAAAVLRLPVDQWSHHTPADLSKAVELGAQPLQRYRCAACGFEAQRYFWQCPGCLGWDSYPNRRIEDAEG